VRPDPLAFLADLIAYIATLKEGAPATSKN
jgi:hypothetical protein